MQLGKSSRRTLIKQGVVAGTTAWATSRMTATSYARVIGANDRINLGLIGCGGRGRYIMTEMAGKANGNTTLVAICDIWKQPRESYPAEAEKAFGLKPKAFEDYREVLEQADVDAVIIATPDHQHAGQTIDAVNARKHVYVEKPIIGIIDDMETLNKLYDTVKASKMTVQNGTHGVSSPSTRAVKQVIAEGKLGKLFRIESTETAYVPYWIHYQGPKTEADTNWKAFLYNRKPRPFDAHLHASWMGYWDITAGTIGGWMTHFINTVHFVTGCGFPTSATAWGGSYAPTNDKRCDAPDQTMVILDYPDGFHTQFTSHFGSEIDNETTVFMFEKGCIKTRFGHWLGDPVMSSEGVNDKIKPQGLLGGDPGYPGAEHVKNWLDCIRNGGEPNANMDYGYKQGVTVAMGDLACKLGRKVIFDKEKREVRAAPTPKG